MKIYNVKSGDSIYNIAGDNEVSADSVMDDNQLSGSSNLTIGQPLVIRDSGKRRTIVNGFTYPFIDNDTLYATLPFLTFLSSFSYHAGIDGNLTLLDDDNVRNMAKNQGVGTLMVVTNMGTSGFDGEIVHSILNDENVQDVLIQNILDVAKDRGFYGVNIDFEYINPEDKELYNNFIKKLSEVLHLNNLLLSTSPAVLSFEPSATQ